MISWMFLILFSSLNAKAQLIPSLNIIREPAPYPGYLYRPNDEKKHPAILLLHGSEGGNGDYWYFPGQEPKMVGEDGIIPFVARYYATLGYVTYAVCYFDCKHHKGFSNYPPDELKNIDLMKVTYPALTWLTENKYVANNKVILWGASRGAEQAILLASELSKMQQSDSTIILPSAVVALSPSEKVVGPLPQEAADAIKKGQSFTGSLDDVAWLLNNEKQLKGKKISISSFPSPVLITSFSEDPVWKHANISALEKQYSVDDMTKIVMTPKDAFESKIKELPAKFKKATFLEFLSKGHVFPPFESEESKMLDKVVSDFFNYSK
ncbi:hypothetical protein K2X05_12510 [bacterium]|nr:hypothetical protein [bacterium]